MRSSRCPDSSQQHVQLLDDIGHQFVGTNTDLLIDIGRGLYLTGQVANREPRPAAADGRSEHDTGISVKCQQRGGTPPG